MLKDIDDPLTAYIKVFRDRFKNVAENTFAELATEAKVDTEANRMTCKQIYSTERSLATAKTRLNRWYGVCILLWLILIGCVVAFFAMYQTLDTQGFIAIGITLIITIILLYFKVRPQLKKLKGEEKRLTETVDKLKNEAWEQMSPLNRLYDGDILTRMMSQTIPRLEFDPYFTTQRLADLKNTYGWDDSFNKERSVIYSLSGLINGNPFVICRTRKMEMSSKTYHGSKIIYWTEYQRSVNGKYLTVHRSEVLCASVTAPYPKYVEKTRLIYGNTAAPDLIFYRKQSDLANKVGTLAYKRKKRSLRKKARDLTNADFAMMTNEDFEVAFNTSNRNNNQQFALLFTPLAQENILKLLKDNVVGFGDDFNFDKHEMINTIVSNHMQELNLNMDPEQYRNFDYEKAKADFYAINARYFRAIYFNLAPLLCIPMYQQIRPQHDIYGHDMQRHSAFWEHEALANFWGQDHFKHPDCVTDCILKTQQQDDADDHATITVYAHGYRSEQRLTYINKWGRDGHLHAIPVYWDEYIPVTGSGQMHIKEDNDFKSDYTSQSQRINHIKNVLDEANLDLYRRHIASKV